MKETPLIEAANCFPGYGHARTCTSFASRKMTFGGKVAKTADRTQPFSFTGIPPHPLKPGNLSVKHSQTEWVQFENFERKYNHATRVAEILLNDLIPKK